MPITADNWQAANFRRGWEATWERVMEKIKAKVKSKWLERRERSQFHRIYADVKIDDGTRNYMNDESKRNVTSMIFKGLLWAIIAQSRTAKR